jgi:hypothetical protein
MADYAPLDPGKYGTAPIDISDANRLWQGWDRTNGFLMRNVNGRIPALEESWSRLVLGASNPLYDAYVVPPGNGLWLDLANIDTAPHALHAGKPAKGLLSGVLKFNQGWQTGNPVQNWGIPPYSTGTLIRRGPVGYKVAMTAAGQEEDYIKCLQGDKAADIPTVRTTFKEWMAAWKAGADGSRLGIFFADSSGFPVVSLVPAASLSNPVLADAGFGGFAEVVEPENEAIYFDINL